MTDIYLHNECAHVGLSIDAPVRARPRMHAHFDDLYEGLRSVMGVQLIDVFMPGVCVLFWGRETDVQTPN